ncbi:MAG TPA: phasin [Pseudolabrys sp.]|nr:phasin [Pseudolabrys sp.]
MGENTSAPSKTRKPAAAAGATSSEAAIMKLTGPTFEVPTALREFAEQGVARAKENYDKVKSAAEQVTEVLEDTCSKATMGYASYGRKLIEAARTNADTTFDFLTEVTGAKSYSEVVELYGKYLRTQFEAVIAQGKELSEHAQKVAIETCEPIKESIGARFRNAA